MPLTVCTAEVNEIRITLRSCKNYFPTLQKMSLFGISTPNIMQFCMVLSTQGFPEPRTPRFCWWLSPSFHRIQIWTIYITPYAIMFFYVFVCLFVCFNAELAKSSGAYLLAEI